jgi:hypothetical protein
MIAEQLLLEGGAVPLLRWTHRHLDGGWQHEVPAAASRLEAAGAAWPEAVAGLLVAGLGVAAAPDARYCSGPCELRHPASVLVSWAYLRAPQTTAVRPA